MKRWFRIKENTCVDDLLARDPSMVLQPGEVRTVFEKAWVYGTWMRAVVTLSPAEDRVTVASDLSVLDTLFTYKKRWEVECTFCVIRVCGLGLEGTHRTAPDRLSRLFGLLCIALARMIRGGKRCTGAGFTDARQAGATSPKYGENRVDAAQSGGALEIGRVLDVPGPH